MARPAKPYLHRGWWVTNFGGKRHKLCREEEGRTAALDAFYRLCGQRPEEGRNFPDLRVDGLIALFLDTLKVEKSESTYLTYQRWLAEFAQQHGHRLATQVTRQDALKFRNDIATRTYTSIRLTRGKAGPATEELGHRERLPSAEKPVRKTPNVAFGRPATHRYRRGIPGYAAALHRCRLPPIPFAAPVHLGPPG